MASVSATGVRKAYGAATVLHDISLEVEDGEFAVLVGPSGCGKSTLLRIIAGLETHTDGDIRIGERTVNGMPPKDRNIAMVFQNYALYPHMTVAQNMGFSLRLAKAPKPEIEKKVAYAADILGLDTMLGRYPKQLSGGQRQRVAMGRAIVRDPQAFLFDEPLRNLDAKLRVKMRAEIKELHQRLGTTTIYVTHDQVEAMTMADKIVVMKDGRIEQVGDPLTLYDRPDNMFVAGFIGSPSMNFIKGTVKNGAFLASGAPISLSCLPDGLEGRDVVLGVRPEHLDPDPAGFAAEVVVVEPTGADTQINARLGNDEIVCVFHERLALRSGEKLTLKVRNGKHLIFDGQTGVRLSA